MTEMKPLGGRRNGGRRGNGGRGLGRAREWAGVNVRVAGGDGTNTPWTSVEAKGWDQVRIFAGGVGENRFGFS